MNRGWRGFKIKTPREPERELTFCEKYVLEREERAYIIKLPGLIAAGTIITVLIWTVWSKL